MVIKAEDALFSIAAGLSFPLLSKSGADSQDFSLLLLWDPHFISLGVHEPDLGAGQENAHLVTGRSCRAKVESCRHLHCGACESLVSQSKCHLQRKLVVSLLLYFVFVIFDSFTFCLVFFLTHNLLLIFSILNSTYLCLWKGMHWFACLESTPFELCFSTQFRSCSTTSVSRDILNATKIRRDSGNLLYSTNLTESYLVVFYSDCHFCLNYRLFRTQEFSKSLPFMAGFLKFQTVFTFLQNYLQTNLIIHLRWHLNRWWHKKKKTCQTQPKVCILASWRYAADPTTFPLS